MAATSQTFAVCVEHDGLNVGQSIAVGGAFHLARKVALQAFDREGGGDLAHEATGVREARLHGEDAARFHIVPVNGDGEHLLNDTPAARQRIARLEQG